MYKTTIEGSILGPEVVNQTIELNSKSLIRILKEKPKGIVNFLVQYHISNSLTFYESNYYYYDKDYYEDESWINKILDKDEIWNIREEIFKKLMVMKLCVKTRYYVSTRGGEKRENELVISPEIRRFLNKDFNKEVITKDQVQKAKLYVFLEQFIYDENVSLSEDDLLKIGPFNSIHPKLEKILDKLEEGKAIESVVYHVIGATKFKIIDDKKYENLLNSHFQKEILDAIFGKGQKIKKEKTKVSEIEDLMHLVYSLVYEKNNLYKSAAMVEGFEFFKSTPDTEKCVFDLFRPAKSEDDLKIFINNLHHFLVECSTKQILKFFENGNSNSTLFEEKLDIDVSEDKIKDFDEVIENFKDLNKLRNHYSHLQDAKAYYKAGRRFYKRINKPFPKNEEDVLQIQKILLIESTQGLKTISEIINYAKEQE